MRRTFPEAPLSGRRHPADSLRPVPLAMRCRWLAAIVLLYALACSPSLYPLYRDYEVNQHSAPVRQRLERALADAEWELVDHGAPNAVATAPRRLRHWGLYSIVVSIEAVPVGNRHVRLFVHPYRYYITGGRSKIPYLKGSIRRRVMAELDAKLEAQGLEAIGTGVSRDRARRR